mmetsp:Transcript_4232/g.5886  ORF Transcript_4232/g.5886 Transcript_4232/m.5886 type:complete len:80 (-) Transcript_4232:20-259(-)
MEVLTIRDRIPLNVAGFPFSSEQCQESKDDEELKIGVVNRNIEDSLYMHNPKITVQILNEISSYCSIFLILLSLLLSRR